MVIPFLWITKIFPFFKFIAEGNSKERVEMTAEKCTHRRKT